jgi:hypothetical protein
MSTRDSYAYAMAAEAQRRAEAAARAREIERQNHALAALLYARSVSESAAYRANVEDVVREQSRVLRAVDRQAADALARGKEIAGAADRAQELSRAIEARITECQAGLRHNLQRAAALQTTLGIAASGLQSTMRDAQSNLDTIARASSASAAFAEVMADATRRGNQEREAVEATLSRIDQLDRELSFVVRDGAFDTAAMATLLAMEANAYQLREVVSGQELVSMFEEKDSQRRIEVRLKKLGSTAENQELWTLATETFEMIGEECLGEITNFETALVDELELGELRRESRQYPKRDRDAQTRSQAKENQKWRTTQS